MAQMVGSATLWGVLFSSKFAVVRFFKVNRASQGATPAVPEPSPAQVPVNSRINLVAPHRFLGRR